MSQKCFQHLAGSNPVLAHCDCSITSGEVGVFFPEYVWVFCVTFFLRKYVSKSQVSLFAWALLCKYTMSCHPAKCHGTYICQMKIETGPPAPDEVIQCFLFSRSSSFKSKWQNYLEFQDINPISGTFSDGNSKSREVVYFAAIQGAVSIRKTVLPGVAIPMLKIRRPNGRLIFNIGIAIPR